MPPRTSHSHLAPDSSHHQPPPSSDAAGSPVHVSRNPSRTPSPFVNISPEPSEPSHRHSRSAKRPEGSKRREADHGLDSDEGSDLELLELQGADRSYRPGSASEGAPPPPYNDDEYLVDDEDMPSDLRPSLHRPTEGRSQTPLLGHKNDNSRGSFNSPSRHHSRRSTGRLHERDPEVEASIETKRRYTIALMFLLLSLVSFTIQTETAVYIQKNLHWEKAYCMLWLTHGSWSLLWPAQLLILRLYDLRTPWPSFWRRHLLILRTTAQMVEHKTLHPTTRQSSKSPVWHMIKVTAFVTCALTVAGGSWYVAVDLTTASDLTAIYNCSAFFAYAFSIPLLKERVRMGKLLAVGIAIVGVLVVAYGDTAPKHGSKSGGGTQPDHDGEKQTADDAKDRALGNIVIGVGSVLYGFYEVLYKKVACPPDDADPHRGVLFANTFGSLIGCFTLFVLWFPLPILHYTGIEPFELPTGDTAWLLFVSVIANATFSGSFLVLISLTSPVLSSVAALLTIFIVALVDQILPIHAPPLTAAAIVGGLLIIGAFLMLSWATYREMQEEQRHKAQFEEVNESDFED